MKDINVLLLLTVAPWLAVAAEAARPRGVSPDCTILPTAFKLASRRLTIFYSRKILQKQRYICLHLQSHRHHPSFKRQRRLLRLP